MGQSLQQRAKDSTEDGTEDAVCEKPVTIGSGVVVGVDAVPVTIEATLGGGSGAPRILGLVDTGIREAYHRILGAFAAQGIPPPRGNLTMNFAPANLRKSGSGFDLPMALALAGAARQFPRTAGLAALGEVSLRGEVLPAKGIVSVALAVKEQGWDRLLTSPKCAEVAALVPGIQVFAAQSIRDALLWLRGELTLHPVSPRPRESAARFPDISDIRGHVTPKTAMMVAAAGRHNLLMVGPPGSGKSALLHRLPGLLPPTTKEEALEILKIHTLSGSGWSSLSGNRPVRCPHHTSSTISLLGGGAEPRPGEITLAQHGILFLDELPEFRREALEGLRQPLEEGRLLIGRARHTVSMPADCLLVCAMNPCPCGYAGHPSRHCACTIGQRQRYHSRVSGPLLDRIDLQVEVPALEPSELHKPPDMAWSTSAMRKRVLGAIEQQKHRFRNPQDYVPNGRLNDDLLQQATSPTPEVLRSLEKVLQVYNLSGRARVRLLRIARTIADLNLRDEVLAEDIVEAAQLRGYECSTAR